jgi:hypothetical protein
MMLDIRDFYQNSVSLDDTDDEEIKQDNDHYMPASQKGKKVKGGNYKTTVYLPKEDIYFENIKLIKYRSLKNM